MKIFTTMLLMTATSGASALNCENIISNINKDLSTYSSNTSTKKFVWANLDWLQQRLGKAKLSKSDNNVANYTWQCKADNRNYITVAADKAGNLSTVNGRFSSPRSAELFSACLSNDCLDAPVKNSPAKTAQLNLCNLVAKQIYDTSLKFQNTPASEDAYYPRYIWESKAWLEKNLGPGAYSRSKQGALYSNNYKQNAIYTWEYEDVIKNSHKNAVYFIASNDGTYIFSSRYCSVENCSMSYFTRNFDQIKTSVTPSE